MQSDTVVQPNAVMVHSDHAAITLRAVMRAWWLYCLTDFTLLEKLLLDNIEFHIRKVPHGTGICIYYLLSIGFGVFYPAHRD